MKNYKRKISRRMATAIFKYKLIEPGDRVLVALSGGKDSMTLLYHLVQALKGIKIPFTLKAIHIRNDFAKNENIAPMEEKINRWGVDYEIVDVPVLDRIKTGEKMSCYWCSTQRRTELLNYADKNGFNKIALGHHIDDIIETFFMNMVLKGELSTMMPLMKYDKYEQKIIRPLALVKEDEIIEFSKEMGFQSLVCTCQWDKNSSRRSMKKIIQQMVKEHGDIRENIYKAMGNYKSDYLPDI